MIKFNHSILFNNRYRGNKLNDIDKILEDISEKHFKKDKFVSLVLKDEYIRDIIVKTMIEHPKIMTYYHCFYIISDASLERPDLFYKYWDELSQLLKHKNSYHRDFGLIILANLVAVDKENKFKEIIDEYLELLYDEKYMTAEVCVKNSAKIASINPKLRDLIIISLLELEKSDFFPEKQKAHMMGNIIDTFDLYIEGLSNKSHFLEFARRHLNSISPKTRRIASLFLKKNS